MMFRGDFKSAQSMVHMPVGPAPKTNMVSPGVMSAIRTDQNPVAKISPTNNACSSETLSGMTVNP